MFFDYRAILHSFSLHRFLAMKTVDFFIFSVAFRPSFDTSNRSFVASDTKVRKEWEEENYRNWTWFGFEGETKVDVNPSRKNTNSFHSSSCGSNREKWKSNVEKGGNWFDDEVALDWRWNFNVCEEKK